MAFRRVSTARKHKRGWRSVARKNLGIRKNSKFGRRHKTRHSGFGRTHKRQTLKVHRIQARKAAATRRAPAHHTSRRRAQARPTEHRAAQLRRLRRFR